MKKLMQYLKPHTTVILLCVVLLFIEALCELDLPDCMSDIVNVGIQQSGIENPTPLAISQNGYSLMTLFMNDEQKQNVASNYELVGKNSTSYEEYAETYPLLKTEDIYILKNQDEDTIASLNTCFARSAISFVNYAKDNFSTSAAKANITNTSEIDFTQIYKIVPVLKKLPSSTFKDAIEKSGSTDEYMAQQTAMTFTKQFYSELGVDTGSMQSSYIFRVGAYMICITAIGAASVIMVSLIASIVGARVSQKLRRDVFEKVESFSNLEFDKFYTSSLITRTTNDITQIQNLIVMGIRMIFYAPILGIGGIIMAMRNSVSMTWVIALGIALVLLLILCVFFIAMPRFKIIQTLVDKLNLVTRESLSGMMVIRAFGTQDFEENRFDQANKNFANVNLFVNRVMAFMFPAMTFIMSGISVLIVWVGGHKIAESTMQVGNMMAFIQYAMLIIMSFLMISMMFIFVPRALVSADRVAEVLDTEVSIKDAKNPKHFGENCRGKIEFRNVSFKYSNADSSVLENINFVANPGETTAFIGSTGSGKSTLINLIPRFYDVTEGQILIDGIDIREVPQKELRKNIGYVPQKGVLFSGDIESNIKYVEEDATQKDIERSAEVAQAIDFINSTENGMKTRISQGGINVSGGQKQRLSIARALVKRAPIYIFDDSLSALDFKTDAALRRALKEYTGSSTVLIVAQRVSTIMHAEQIVVIDEGKVVGIGTHEELIKNCETYKEIAKSQLSEEELK